MTAPPDSHPAPAAFRRVEPDEARRWIDDHTRPVAAEECPLHRASGRRLARAVSAPRAVPATAVAATDGFALRAAETQGAGSYSPLPLRLAAGDAPLAPGAAAPVVSGQTLPPGADAVLPLDGADLQGGGLEVCSPVARGEHVIPAGEEAVEGGLLLPAGRRLRPQDLSLLAAAGVAAVAVTAAPTVRLCLTRPGAGAAGEHLLRALVERDGGRLEPTAAAGDGPALGEALTRPGADLILVAGASGLGANDFAVGALRAAGELAFHGVALHPGDTAAAGQVGATPVIVLPGRPLAALWAYELLAGPALRRLAGGRGDWPYRSVELPLARKVASALGRLEFCRVRLSDAGAEPIAVADGHGLATAVAADGFVSVPVHSEGHAAGTVVRVHLYDAPD